MRRLALGVACTAIACGPGEASLFVALPPHAAGMNSIVVALEKSSGLELVARALDGSQAINFGAAAFGGEATIELHALLYEQTLERLQLPDGVVAAAQPNEPRARSLMPAKEMFSAEVALSDATRGVSWESISMRPAAIDAFKLPAEETPCAEFAVEAHLLDSAANGAFAVAIDGESALLGATDGRFFRVHQSGAIARLEPEGGYAPYLSALPAEGGEFWLGGPAGQMYRVRIEGDQLIRTGYAFSPQGGRIHWLAGEARAGFTEIFALTIEGSFDRYDGAQFTHLYDFNYEEGLDWKGGVARIAAGEAVAVFPFDPLVVRHREGVVSEEEIPPSGALHAVTHSAALGTFVGESEGQVLRRRGAEWVRMEESPLHVWLLSIEAYEDGFVYGSAFGNFGQYVEGYGFCELLAPVAFSVRYLLVLGRDILLFGANPNTEQLPVAIMRRVN